MRNIHDIFCHVASTIISLRENSQQGAAEWTIAQRKRERVFLLPQYKL